VKIDNVVTRFHGKHLTAIQLKNDALEFLKMLTKRH
jgi:hypothetical protein